MLLRWHHLRRSLSALHRLSFALLFTLIFLCAKGALPYDNAVRLSIRFNAQKAFASLVGPLQSDRWLLRYEEPPAFPLDWAAAARGDVGIVLKTGYGTRERAVAWLEAWLSSAIFSGDENGHVEGNNVMIVGDFEGKVRVSRGRAGPADDALVLKVHDVVAEVLLQCEQDHSDERLAPEGAFSSTPRGEQYMTLRAAIAAGENEQAMSLSESFGWELDAIKFIPALDLAFRTMPHKKWYLLVDDDTYLIQPSLNLILGHFDPDVPHYLGNAVGDYRQRFAHGGSAIALSRAAMRELFGPSHGDRRHQQKLLATARHESLTETWGDRLLARTLLKLGIHIDEGASRFFNGEPPWAARLRKDRFCVPVTAFHRLGPEEMREVGRVFGRTVDPVVWADLWEMYGAPSFDTYMETPVRRDWDHVGALDEQTSTVERTHSAVACWRLCTASKNCLAWTWEEVLGEGVCHMSPWITVGKEEKGKESGLHVERAMNLADGCL